VNPAFSEEQVSHIPNCRTYYLSNPNVSEVRLVCGLRGNYDEVYHACMNPRIKVDHLRMAMSGVVMSRMMWSHISTSQGITMDDIESNPDLPWHWDTVGSNPNMTFQFMESHLKPYDFICTNPFNGQPRIMQLVSMCKNPVILYHTGICSLLTLITSPDCRYYINTLDIILKLPFASLVPTKDIMHS
jgi:hypothetical protein